MDYTNLFTSMVQVPSTGIKCIYLIVIPVDNHQQEYFKYFDTNIF